MSSSSLITCSFPHNYGIRSPFRSPVHNSVIFKRKYPIYFQINNFVLRDTHLTIRNFVASARSDPPEAPLPSNPSSNPNFIKQIMGVMMTFILPVLSSKFGQFWIFRNKIENAVETVEVIVNAAEKVAEQVEKVAEDVADDLPDGNLKKIVDFVEDVAENAAHSADSLGDLIDKVEEAEEQLRSFVESTHGDEVSSKKENDTK